MFSLAPKISVIVPSKGKLQQLKRCLNALHNQSLEKHLFEVLVVSDGHNHQTESLVLSYKSYNFKYLYLAVKSGAAAARNLGWHRATGKLLVFTDEESIPQPKWLQLFFDNQTVAMLAAYAGTVSVPVNEYPTDYERTMTQMENEILTMSNCALTLAAMECVGGFDERFNMTWDENKDLEFKLLQQQIPLNRIPDAIVIHPPERATWGISIANQRKNMFDVLLYKKHPELFRQLIQPKPAWDNYIITASFLVLVTAIINKGWWIALAALVCYMLTLVGQIIKRLLFTSRTPAHVWEVILTSIIIPFVSVYWQLYGAFRYRVLYL